MRLVEAEFYLYEDMFDVLFSASDPYQDEDLSALSIHKPKMVWRKGKFDIDRYICHWHNTEGDLVINLEGGLMITVKLDSKILNAINKANEGGSNRTGEK